MNTCVSVSHFRGEAEAIRLNPGSLPLWSRWAREPIDGSQTGLLAAAKHFPSLALRPEQAQGSSMGL